MKIVSESTIEMSIVLFIGLIARLQPLVLSNHVFQPAALGVALNHLRKRKPFGFRVGPCIPRLKSRVLRPNINKSSAQ